MLLAAVVVALVVGGVLLWRRRRARRSWAGEVDRVTTELRWANDQLVPSLLTAPTAGVYAQAWSDGRPRLVAADQELYGLARRAPDETRAASVAGLRPAIAGLIAAIDAEASLETTDPDERRAARAGVERARSEFAAALDVSEEKPQPAAPEPAPRP